MAWRAGRGRGAGRTGSPDGAEMADLRLEGFGGRLGSGGIGELPFAPPGGELVFDMGDGGLEEAPISSDRTSSCGGSRPGAAGRSGMVVPKRLEGLRGLGAGVDPFMGPPGPARRRPRSVAVCAASWRRVRPSGRQDSAFISMGRIVSPLQAESASSSSRDSRWRDWRSAECPRRSSARRTVIAANRRSRWGRDVRHAGKAFRAGADFAGGETGAAGAARANGFKGRRPGS